MPDPDVIGRLDRLVDEAAERYNAMSNKLREETGDRPWGSEVLSPQEKLERFEAIWDDDDVWGRAVERERAVYGLPPGAIPKRLIREALELTQRLQERG